ncbi:hypothetical protein I4U23_016629 [Adineta vaga]|nr:hypothetical protein I4U23_016629 [Adineta vaga]
MATSITYRQKHALIIGINKYSCDPLNYCTNDTNDLAMTLKRMDFHVLSKVDCNYREFDDTINRFVEQIKEDDLVFFYFSGHSKQFNNENYLLPSDYSYNHQEDEYNHMTNHSFNIKSIIKKMDERKYHVASENLIVYTYAPDKAVQDETRNNQNGCFMQNLLKSIMTFNKDIEEIMSDVGRDVKLQTQGSQSIYRISCLTNKVFLMADISSEQNTVDSATVLSKEKKEINPTLPIYPNMVQRYPSVSLYVADLHPDVTEAMLLDKFASAGPILSIRLCRDLITRRSLGHAYVNFQEPADAERAIDTMNFNLLRGRPLRIIWVQDLVLLRSDTGRVSIRNLDKNIDDTLLYNTFSAFGYILTCKIMKDEAGQSKGFGFVHFDTQEAADAAINKVNGMLLGDKQVCLSPSVSRNPHTDGGAAREFIDIFIKNFGDQLDEEKLRQLLSKYGKILKIKIEYDENGHSKGFGFCRFENSDEAEEAVKNLNGYSVGDKQLYVGRFRRKQKCRNPLKYRYMQHSATSRVPGQMMSNNAVRPQGDLEQPATAYRRTARKIPTNNQGGFRFPIVGTGQKPLTPAALANVTPEEQKQMLGERLYPLVKNMQPELAGKITGMILEFDNTELLHMLESRESLKAKVEEAVAILQAHRAKQICAATQDTPNT